VLDPEEPTPGLSITFGIKGQEGRGGAFVSVPPPPEVADRGLNLPGLESWARALGGHVSTNLPETLSVKGVADREQVPVSRGFLMWVVPLLFLDLLVKRLMPGRPFFRARSGITSHLESPFTPSSSATQSRIPRRS